MAAPLGRMLFQLSRLRIGNAFPTRNIATQGGPRLFWSTPVLSSSPMKKKKKADPTILIQREQKKRKRIEKAIKKLEAKGRKLKPIDEIDGFRDIIKTAELRQREPAVLSFEESERRALLVKEWARYKKRQHFSEMSAIRTAMAAQEKALEELRKESEELYQQAIQIDPELLPFERRGPVSTPPIQEFDPPDGEYKDTTRVYDK